MDNNSFTLSTAFYALFVLVSFYVPLQTYARRIEKKLTRQESSLISNRHKSILISYLIWYAPCFALLVIVPLTTSFGIVAVLVITSIGWIWLGHSYVQAISH